jgi:hypothetical protein
VCDFHFIYIFVPSHWTPLFWASVNGNDELCGLLVSFKADVNAKDKMYDALFCFGMPSKWPTFCHQATNPAALFFWYGPFKSVPMSRALQSGYTCERQRVRYPFPACVFKNSLVFLYSFALLGEFLIFFLQSSHRIALVF